MDFKLSDACVECRDSIAYHAVVSWRYAWNILEGSMYAHDCQAISMCRRARTYTIYPQTQTFVLFISLINAIWLFNIAMENPKNKWRFLAGKIIYFYGPSIPWLCLPEESSVCLKIGCPKSTGDS